MELGSFWLQEKEQLESELQSMGLMAHEVERPAAGLGPRSNHNFTVFVRRSEEIRALHDQAAEVRKTCGSAGARSLTRIFNGVRVLVSGTSRTAATSWPAAGHPSCQLACEWAKHASAQ